MRKLTSLLAAIALAASSLAPAAAEARDRHGRYHDRHDHHYRYHRDHDDGDAAAAGVIGLVLGLAIGSMASGPREPDCYDNYRRCAPPPQQRGYYDPRYDDRGYGEDLEGDYDPRYEDPRAAYERDYGRTPDAYVERAPECTRRERQWDRYANRYLMVDVPC